MQFAMRHWFNFGAAALVFLLCGSSGMGFLQRVLLVNFIIQLILQYEEYGRFGRELAMKDMVFQSSAESPHYRDLGSYSICLLHTDSILHLSFLPDAIWLGLAPVLFGFMRFAIPVARNHKLWAIYPRRRAVLVFGHVSIGVVYLYHIHAHHLVTMWDWVSCTC
jgi:hypothetical protein